MENISETVAKDLTDVVASNAEKMSSLESSIKMQMDIMNNRIKADMTPKLDECLVATARCEGVISGLTDRVKLTEQELKEQVEEMGAYWTEKVDKVCEAAELEAFLMHLAAETDIAEGLGGL